MKLADRLAGLELATIPIWVLDPEPIRIRWVNGPALELWRARDRDELLSRDFGAAPKAIKARMEAALTEVREGRSFWSEWTFFPKGVPVQVKLHFAPIELDDGRLGILQQVLPREEAPDPAVVRATEALTHTSVVVAIADFQGKVFFKNPAAMASFNKAGDAWTAWLADPTLGARLLETAEAGEVAKMELVARTDDGDRWHSIEVRPILDAVSGERVALIHHTDETARREAEEQVERKSQLIEELDRTISLVNQQREEILELTAPLLEVGPRTLAVPIVGALDRRRSAEIGSRLLSAIQERRAQAVVVDVTGVRSLDASSAEHLLQIVRAVRLLGARVIITGVCPSLARALAELGLDSAGVPFLRSLADGIRWSLT